MAMIEKFENSCMRTFHFWNAGIGMKFNKGNEIFPMNYKGNN